MYLRSCHTKETVLSDVTVRGRLMGFPIERLIRLLERLE